MDGVLVDTAHYHFIAWRKLAKELGIDLSEKDNERLKGVSRMRSLEIILELGGVNLSEAEKKKRTEIKNTWFVGYINAMKPEEIFPGVKELILNLKKSGIRVALASSSRNADTVIRLLKIESLFEAIVDGTMITHSKPDPEIFLLAARKLGVAPEFCLVFEDAEAGVEAALRAGMKCIGVGSAEQLGKAHQVVNSTADFDLANMKTL